MITQSHIFIYITFVKICKSGRHFFLFAFRMCVVLLEKPGVVSMQFGKIISEIPTRLTPLAV